MKHWSESLKELNACANVVAYCKDFPSLESAWSTCERGDWMLWYAEKTSGKAGSSSRLKVVAAAAECAEIALPLFDKKSVRTCIETTLAYINGVATYTAYAAACANASAACADAALESKRKETLKQCADIMRRHYPTPPTNN